MSPVTQSTYIFRQFIEPLKKKILTLVYGGSTGTPYVFYLQKKQDGDDECR